VSDTPAGIPTAKRARWLAELAQTLARAHEILDEMKLQAHDPALNVILVRIGAVEREVRLLQAGRPQTDENSPKWTNFALWEDGPLRAPIRQHRPENLDTSKQSK